MTTSGIDADISWNIVGTKNGKNRSISGSGTIFPGKMGILRNNATDCYDALGRSIGCNGLETETLDYFYDETMGINTFLSSGISDPYLLIYNAGPNADITLETNTPFALPKLEVTTEARK